MKLQKFLAKTGSVTKLADHLNLSVASVSYWKTGEREVPAKYCKMIEQFTNGKVTVKDLRPDDWKLYWG